MALSVIRAFLILALLCGCDRIDRDAVIHDITSYVGGKQHTCVPLGWNAVPVDDGYVIGTSIEWVPNGWWFQPMWEGYIPASARITPDVRDIMHVMSALERRGMITETNTRFGRRYFLTLAATKYYFDGNAFETNRLRAPFLCYAKVAVIRAHALTKQGSASVLRIDWRSGPSAAWANDPVIRAHSVVVGASASPLFVHYTRTGRAWDLHRVAWGTQPR